MTLVLKPLKFLHPHYPDLQALHETWLDLEDKVSATASGSINIFQHHTHNFQSLFADILSVLTMTHSDTQPCGTL
jgi:26S proteasome regulatory subunit N1